MARKSAAIVLNNSDVNDLTILSSSVHDPILARRANVILECARGLTNKEVSAITGMNEADVGRWRKAFIADGIDGLRGKRRGGNNRPDAPDESFYIRLDELLMQVDKNWTVQELVQELESTPNIVSAALRKRGIHLQRKRQWAIVTRDELIPKTVDVVGLFLSKNEQAIVIRCTQEGILECYGEFITRNRELSEDFLHYEGEISLADAINTAIHHVADTTRMNP